MTKKFFLKINPYIRWGIVNFVVLYLLAAAGGNFTSEDNEKNKISHKKMIDTKSINIESSKQYLPKNVSSKEKELPPLFPESTTTGSPPNSDKIIKLESKDFALVDIRLGRVEKVILMQSDV